MLCYYYYYFNTPCMVNNYLVLIVRIRLSTSNMSKIQNITLIFLNFSHLFWFWFWFLVWYTIIRLLFVVCVCIFFPFRYSCYQIYVTHFQINSINRQNKTTLNEYTIHIYYIYIWKARAKVIKKIGPLKNETTKIYKDTIEKHSWTAFEILIWKRKVKSIEIVSETSLILLTLTHSHK